MWDDLIAFGTGGGNTLDDQELTLAQRALVATLSRIGITLSFPWRDFSTFKAHWLRNGCSGSWQARRDLLNELFAPIQAELDRQEEAQFRAVNAEAVSPRTKTGWPKVDEELTELRRRFRTATTTAGLPRRWKPRRRRAGGAEPHHLRPLRTPPAWRDRAAG